MRERARLSLRHVGLLALATMAGGLACHDEGPLTDQEMTLLRGFLRPDGPAPPDPSNVYGDSLAAARLGKLLYFETRFAGELLAPDNVDGADWGLGAPGQKDRVACASCHDPLTGGADRRSKPNATSLGAAYTGRNAPSVINAAYTPLWQFWDGRSDSLWSQALSPPEGRSECNSSRLKVVHVLDVLYRGPYEEAFGAGSLPTELADLNRFPATGKPGGPDFDDMTPEDKALVNRIFVNFGKAIAAYERRLISNAFAPSPFDAFMAGDTQAMSPAAVRGASLFVGRAGCAECHRGPDGMFSDYAFHNVGAPQTGEHAPASDLGRATGIGALTASMKDIEYNFTRQSDFSDLLDDTHLSSLSLLDDDTTRKPFEGQFKTPSLRNVAKTAPYMHDGTYQTLWDVVNHYNFGGATGPYAGTKDLALAPLLLTDAEIGDLVEFLRALDDGDPLETHDFDQEDYDLQGLAGQPKLPPWPTTTPPTP